MKEIYTHCVYKHYKGNCYVTIAVANHTETGERLVIYRPLYSLEVYARPYEMFAGNAILDGQEVERFLFVEEMS